MIRFKLFDAIMPMFAATGSRSHDVFCSLEEDALELFRKNGLIDSEFNDNEKDAVVSPPEIFLSLPSS